jgi:hypothetical protein
MLAKMEANRLGMGFFSELGLNDATEFQMCGIFPSSGQELPVF